MGKARILQGPIVVYFLLLVGILGIFGGVLYLIEYSTFYDGILVDGTVVELIPERSSQPIPIERRRVTSEKFPREEIIVYRPRISFTTLSGESFTFFALPVEHLTLLPPTTVVPILYQKDNPRQAIMRDDLEASRYGIFFSSAVGVVFLLLARWYARKRKRIQEQCAWFRKYGRPLTTTITRVERSPLLYNGAYRRWVIVSEGKDPTTGNIGEFRSDSLMKGFSWSSFRYEAPAKQGQTITVYLDPHHPVRYWMDVLELPNAVV